MSYQFKTACKRVVLHVLVGGDKSLIGLKIHNCSVVSMKFEEFYNLIMSIYGEGERNHLIYALAERQLITNDSELIILEMTENEEYLGIDEYDFFRMLKLYKAEDIYSCYHASYCIKEGNVVSGGNIHNIKYEHAIDFLPTRYKLEDWEMKYLPQWYDRYFVALHTVERNPQFWSMLRAYDTSYLVGIPEMEYIMLFSVLEMIFGSGHSEITYQISRGTALLLSSNSDDMEKLYKRMKKLYGERSQYVHSGKKIKIECLYELRDIVRRVLVVLINLEYHKMGASFTELQRDIMLGGFQTPIEKRNAVCITKL